MTNQHRITIFIPLLIGLFLSACQPEAGGEEQAMEPTIDSTYLAVVVSELSSDTYQGRKPFSAAEGPTLAYLESQMKAIGLQAGNGDSYFQEVPMVEISGTAAPTMTVEGNGQQLEFELAEEYVAQSPHVKENINIEDAEMVFCGYGITAPEYNWNDFEGVDMKGKIAIVMVNDPGYGGADSTFFKGNTMTYYGRWTYKFEEAARQGAAGVFVIHEDGAAGYPWFVVKRSGTGSRLYLQNEDDNASRCAMHGWLSQATANTILEAAGQDPRALMTAARKPGFKAVALGMNASTSIQNQIKRDRSKNVIGILPGSGKTDGDEYVIYTAHWDHLGIASPVEGDSIYNGALDNATGTASVLTIAKAFGELPHPTRRTLVFLLVTAEEQGLLGSAYYAQNPIFPTSRTVAALNMDGMNIHGPMKDVTVVGYGQSELEDLLGVEAKKQGRYILPEQEPEKGFYFRSDHFNFAKVGIPALNAKGGYDHAEKGKEYAMERKKEYTYSHYHRPSDEFRPANWDFRGMVQDAELYFRIGRYLAESQDYPQWREGSEFKAARDRDLGS
jgi:Zn-dependent M28 family amino/carboxypeptidase